MSPAAPPKPPPNWGGHSALAARAGGSGDSAAAAVGAVGGVGVQRAFISEPELSKAKMEYSGSSFYFLSLQRLQHKELLTPPEVRPGAISVSSCDDSRYPHLTGRRADFRA